MKPIWPESIRIEGIEYKHSCYPTTFASRIKWTCPCGRVWYRDGKSWVHQKDNTKPEPRERVS